MDILFIFILSVLLILSTKKEENVLLILCFVLVIYFYIQFKTEQQRRIEGYQNLEIPTGGFQVPPPRPQPCPQKIHYDTRIDNTDRWIDNRCNDQFLKQPQRGNPVPYNFFAPRDRLADHDLYSYKNMYYNRLNLRQKQSNFNRYNSLLHKFDKHYPKSKLSWFYY